MDSEEPERLTPPVPEPPRVPYERPAARADETIRGPRGVQVGVGEMRGMGDGWEIATALVSSLVAGILLGLAADRWWIRASTPWGVIVGVLLGSISGFTKMFQMASRLNREPGDGTRR